MQAPNAATWPTVERLFSEALKLPPDRVEEWLAAACAHDERMLREVRSLVEADRAAADFLLPKPRSEAHSAPEVPFPPTVDAHQSNAHQSNAHQSNPFRPGALLCGRFRMIRFLAAGGMADVYEAEDTRTGERVALKVLRDDSLTAESIQERSVRAERSVRRLRREVRLAQAIDHPAVCRLDGLYEHAAGPETEPVVFLAMELLRGETLSERLDRDGPLTQSEALPILRQIVEALAAAHARGIIHRDLKAANIFLEEHRVVVTDFGLARRPDTPGDLETVTDKGTLIGTPAYLSPEQLTAEELTPASDIYALGVLIYRMLTGQFPFTGDDPFQALFSRLKRDPQPLSDLVEDLDPRWARLAEGCLRRDPKDRFNSAEILRVLHGIPEDSPSEDSPSRDPWQRSLRNLRSLFKSGA